MTILGCYGAELQPSSLLDEVSQIVGTVTVDTGIKRSGAASFKVAGSIAAGAVGYLNINRNFALQAYYQVAFYIDSLDDTVGTCYMKVTNTAGTNTYLDFQMIDVSGTINPFVYYNNYASTLTYTGGITKDEWHVAEMYVDQSSTNGSRTLTLKVDGVTVATSSSVTNVLGTPGNLESGIYNAGGSTISGSTVYFDDAIIATDWLNQAKLVLAVPTGAGDNAADAGDYTAINEIPPSSATTVNTARIDLDTNSSVADYQMTDSSTMGIDSYDEIVFVSPWVRIREESATASGYRRRIKSASGGTVATESTTDAGNTTIRTNPTGTTAHTNFFARDVDPTTGVAWTPTGTNSIDNMQIGVDSTTANDLWVVWLGAYVGYREGTPPSGGAVKDLIGLGIVAFER